MRDIDSLGWSVGGAEDSSLIGCFGGNAGTLFMSPPSCDKLDVCRMRRLLLAAIGMRVLDMIGVVMDGVGDLSCSPVENPLLKVLLLTWYLGGGRRPWILVAI